MAHRRQEAYGSAGNAWLSGRVSRALQTVVIWGERALALAVFGGVMVFAASIARDLSNLDWSEADTFYQFLTRALLLAVGLEFARMLVTHDMLAVLELMAFVLARTILKPDIEAVETMIMVLGFVVLLVARRFIVQPDAVPGPSERATGGV